MAFSLVNLLVMKRVLILCFLALAIAVVSCKKNKEEADPASDTSDNSFNLFSLEDDKALGLQVSQQIESDSSDYNVMDTALHASSYSHLNRIVNTILESGEVAHKDDFVWRVRLIEDDSTLNAFCTPGGYIYVFTGLIKYLESEDQLAGVIGHEIAHADRRHSTDQLSKQYGYSLLFSVLLGDQSALGQVVQGVISLKYSRGAETEADEYSVRYLCPTSYNAAGGAGFFEKIEASGGSSTPEFLSTHPSPENRIPTFYDWQNTLGCDGTDINTDLYQDFKNSLP